jgi:hypothetical protein
VTILQCVSGSVQSGQMLAGMLPRITSRITRASSHSTILNFTVMGYVHVHKIPPSFSHHLFAVPLERGNPHSSIASLSAPVPPLVRFGQPLLFTLPSSCVTIHPCRITLDNSTAFSMRDLASHVEQSDALIGVLTVEETLRFAARLR